MLIIVKESEFWAVLSRFLNNLWKRGLKLEIMKDLNINIFEKQIIHELILIDHIRVALELELKNIIDKEAYITSNSITYKLQGTCESDYYSADINKFWKDREAWVYSKQKQKNKNYKKTTLIKKIRQQKSGKTA